MAATSWTLLPVEGPAKDLQDITSIEYGLSGAMKHLRARSSTGHKERADMDALQKHTGTKAKHVKVTFRDETLRVEVLTLPKEHTVVVDGTLFQEISAKDCTWAIEDVPKAQQGERKLVLSLEKKKKMRWLMLMRS